MASVNKVIIVGHLGKDPETRYMPNGDAVCNITVATSESWKDKASGEKREITEWHRVVFYRKLAEIAGQYLKKGSAVYIEGRIRTRKWQDKEGNDRYTTEVRVGNMQMLGGRQGGGAAPAGGRQTQGENQFSGGARSRAQQQSEPAPSNEPPMDFDDDIPF